MLFVLTGLVFGSWAASIPAVQHRLALSSGALGLVAVVLEGAAVVGLLLGGALVGRLGSRVALRLALVAFALGLIGLATAPTLGALLAVVGGWAAANSVIDVALNTQGAHLEARAGRSLLSGLHAGHSLGLLLGAGVAVAAAAVGVDLLAHFGAIAIGAVLVGLLAVQRLEREPHATTAPRRVRADRGLLLVAALAFCAFALDAAAASWSAVHLRTDLQAAPVVAALAYGGFAAAMLLGRTLGDRALTRFGRRAVVTVCGVGAAGAVGLITAVPVVPVVLAAWALLGLAVAPLVPAVLGAAGDRGRSPAASIASTTSIGYLGSFSVPPLVGLVAAGASVTVGLVLLLPVALAVALLARPALPRSNRNVPVRERTA